MGILIVHAQVVLMVDIYMLPLLGLTKPEKLRCSVVILTLRIDILKHASMCTQVVLMADIDMLPSLDQSTDLIKPKKLRALTERLGAGYIIALPVLAVRNNRTYEDALEVATNMVTGAH